MGKGLSSTHEAAAHAQQQRPEEGARKCILSRTGSRARAHRGKNRGQIHHGVAVMRRPLRVRRIQQRALGAPRQLAETRGEKGAQSHGARVFAAAFASARIFFWCRWVHWVVSLRFMLLACTAACYHWQGLPQLLPAARPVQAEPPRNRRRSRTHLRAPLR